LLLVPNPSHLELVNPVQMGIVRSKQTYLQDKDRNRIIPITLHGDAAFTGQGIVQETLGLSEMPGYRTGGTIHVIINNQIGFTATPKQTRFTPYPTDIAKSIQAPVLVS
jgi:2-oxoglutarate dehydrogenase E1 component